MIGTESQLELAGLFAKKQVPTAKSKASRSAKKRRNLNAWVESWEVGLCSTNTVVAANRFRERYLGPPAAMMLDDDPDRESGRIWCAPYAAPWLPEAHT